MHLQHPRLKFRVDYKKDINTFYAFVREAGFSDGRNLEWAIFKKYPQFKKYKKDGKLKVPKKEVSAFVKNIYLQNKKIIEKNINLYKRNWSKIEKNYFKLIGQLFNGYKWPKGRYIAYPTIWGMYPRFLEDKTFQVPYRHKKEKYINVIIAHELLHFIFYNYFYKNYPKFKSDKYNFFVWNVSEIFNAIIQNSPHWVKLFGLKSMIYPEHKQVLKKLKNSMSSNKLSDIKANDLIKKIISLSKK